MENKIHYPFNHFEIALTAFTSSFENKINRLIPDIPVMFLDNGDEVYWFKRKFETSKKDGIKDNTLKIPRVVFGFESVELQTDQDTNQYVKTTYNFNDNNFKVQTRRKAISLPIKATLVSSNFLFALSYYEMLLSILCIDNVFTYDYCKNTYQASYNSDNITLEKNQMDNGGTKNYVINFNINLQLQPFIIRPETIQQISNDGGLIPMIQLDTVDSHLDRTIDFIDLRIDQIDND